MNTHSGKYNYIYTHERNELPKMISLSSINTGGDSI